MIMFMWLEEAMLSWDHLVSSLARNHNVKWPSIVGHLTNQDVKQLSVRKR